jgi:hypothetical protein
MSTLVMSTLVMSTLVRQGSPDQYLFV